MEQKEEPGNRLMFTKDLDIWQRYLQVGSGETDYLYKNTIISYHTSYVKINSRQIRQHEKQGCRILRKKCGSLLYQCRGKLHK